MDNLLTEAEIAECFTEGIPVAQVLEKKTMEILARFSNKITKAQDTKTRKVIREGLENRFKGVEFMVIHKGEWQNFWEE